MKTYILLLLVLFPLMSFSQSSVIQNSLSGGSGGGGTIDPSQTIDVTDSVEFDHVKRGAFRHLRALSWDSTIVISIATQDEWVTFPLSDMYRFVEADDQFEVSGNYIIYNDPSLSTAHYDWLNDVSGEGSTGIEYELRFVNITDDNVFGQTKKEYGASANDDSKTVYGYDNSVDHRDSVIIQIRNTEGTQDFTFNGGFIKADYNHE